MRPRLAGLVGCEAWIAPQVAVAMASTNGAATWSLPIPAVAALAGTRLGVQLFVADFGATNGVGSVSNALLVRVH